MTKDEGSVGKWISILNRHGQAYISKNLKKYDIGSGQYIFIITLFDNNGISQDKLSEILSIDKGTTARALQKLEAKGYIRREIDDKDKRAYKVYATEKAYAIKPEIFKVLKASSNILSENLTDTEKKLAIDLLKKMSVNAVSKLK